jgi:hypothetical protein
MSEPTPFELPEHLREGWEIFLAYQKGREVAGDPLPPGGVFAYSRSSILRDELVAYRHRLATRLGVSLDCVVVTFEVDGATLHPHTQVDPPRTWYRRQMGGKDLGTRAEEHVRQYLRSVIDECYGECQASMARRCADLDGRDDLKPREVENLLGRHVRDHPTP